MYAKGKAILEEAQAAYKRNSGTTTFHQVFADYLEWKWTVKGRKQKTIENDGDNYRLHIKPYIGAKPITAIAYADLEAIQQRLITAKIYRTANLVTILLKGTYKYAMKKYRSQISQGLPLMNIADDLEPVKVPQVIKKDEPVKTWTVEQISAFLLEAKRRYDTNPRSLYYPAYYTILAAELRRGEILGLKRHALKKQDDEWFLHITEQLVYSKGKHRRDTPKTEASVRRVAITQEHAAILQAHMERLD